jgi:hypothetical protein
MDKGKIGDLIALVIIVLLGLGTAYVTFGILQSQASTEVRQYSLGGAIAGALVAMSMSFSAYTQFRRSSGELEKLRDRLQELQQKVLRGAPCPRGFEIEVDERQRIVLAKPARWEPRGGMIFDFELPKEKLRTGDLFPARLQVSYGPITLENQTADDFYEKTRRTFLDSPLVGSWTSEFINVGGEPNSIKSLKIIFQMYGKIISVENPLTGKDETQTYWITREEFENALKPADAPSQDRAPQDLPPQNQIQPAQSTATPATSVGAVSERVAYKKIWQMQVACLHEDLKKIFILNFYDDENDFTQSSALFNQVLDSVRFLN